MNLSAPNTAKDSIHSLKANTQPTNEQTPSRPKGNNPHNDAHKARYRTQLSRTIKNKAGVYAPEGKARNESTHQKDNQRATLYAERTDAHTRDPTHQKGRQACDPTS